MSELILGREVAFPDKYDPSILFAVPRKNQRSEIGIEGAIPFSGFDQWNCYEVSWISTLGLPVSAIAIITYPCDSDSIVESKSLKLYLGSLNNTKFGSREEVEKEIVDQLNALLSTSCKIKIFTALEYSNTKFRDFSGVCLEEYFKGQLLLEETPQYSQISTENRFVEETLYTHLFRSLCPVTGQPDWASVEIQYEGPALKRENLLSYLSSYRSHKGFHEICCEQIYVDIYRAWEQFDGEKELLVNCQFLRRGGIDINPVRHSSGFKPIEIHRTKRQ